MLMNLFLLSIFDLIISFSAICHFFSPGGPHSSLNHPEAVPKERCLPLGLLAPSLDILHQHELLMDAWLGCISVDS